jgi:hypothetical protein
MEEFENKGREEIFSQAVRAGKRTYFFDVKATRAGDYYLTITESKRRFNNDQGKYSIKKISKNSKKAWKTVLLLFKQGKDLLKKKRQQQLLLKLMLLIRSKQNKVRKTLKKRTLQMLASKI